MSSPQPPRRPARRRSSLSVTLRRGGAEVAGELLELSSRACRASFREALPALAAGDVVELEFRGLLLFEPLRLEAAVASRSARGERSEVQLDFLDPEAVQQRVPYVLQSEFSRRAARRVTIDEVVEVELSADALEAAALLLEISTGGVGLRVAPELAALLSEGQALELFFRLPGRAEPFRLAGTVRGLRALTDGIGCSVQFDEHASGDFVLQREALAELLRGRAEDQRSVPGS